MEFKSIIYNDCNELIIAKDYLADYIKKHDKRVINNFLQIIKHLDAIYTIEGKELVNTDGSTVKYPIELSLKSALGKLQRAEIVKKLKQHECSYEVRIDSEYEHQRLIFFAFDSLTKSLIFTYGYTKINGNNKTDLTDLAASKTDIVSKMVHESDENMVLWIGDEQNEYKFPV